MIIRTLKGKERIEAAKISEICFHIRDDNIESHYEAWENSTMEDWGAFADDGTLMARIINNHYECRFDGSTVRMGGIGGVSTLPEYRNCGAIRSVFSSLLPAAYERGEVFSSLYPFNHGFYRKFGYETVISNRVCHIPLSELSAYRHTGWVKQWKETDDVTPYVELYETFAARYNISVVRCPEAMREVSIHGECFRDGYFCYLLGTGEKPLAYVCYKDSDGGIRVRDFAFDGRDGLCALLGFLARFTADYHELEIELPSDLSAFPFVKNPYNITETPRNGFMARVVNAERALSLMKKPPHTQFTIRIQDGILPQNCGVFSVSDTGVRKISAATADMDVSEKALAPLILGATELHEAMLRPDVAVYGNTDTLAAVFVRKPLYIADHF